MPFKIVRNDLTKMMVDAIVNTANMAPVYSSGVDTAVYKAAGEKELLAARKKIGYLDEGEVAITPGFKLPAKYIIHAVSPYYMGGTYGEEEKLRSCYRGALELALEKGCESIAFPLIATGSFGYPKEEGMRIALDEINAFLLKESMLVYLVVFDTQATALGVKVYPDLEAYIDHHYVCDKREEEYGDRYFGSMRRDDPRFEEYQKNRDEMEAKLAKKKASFSERILDAMKLNDDFDDLGEELSEAEDMPAEEADDFPEIHSDEYFEVVESALSKRMRHLSDTFQEYMFYLIESKGLSNAEVYKRAWVSKKLFSKIKCNPEYHPDKATAMRLCVGCKLNLDETKDLLGRAGYALSPCDKRDIIFSYFIEKHVYDMVDIDIALEDHGLPCFLD